MKVAIVGGVALVIMAFDAPRERYDFLHDHPPEDLEIHQKFYNSWLGVNGEVCCSNKDCYPTEVQIVGGNIFAKRREDGKFIPVPAETIDHKRDSPDGRNHLCAPAPDPVYQPDTVYCFVLGKGM